MGRKRKRKVVEAKPFCFYCDREYNDEPALIQHQRQKHFKCSLCPRNNFQNTRGVKLHMRKIHDLEFKTVLNAIDGRDDVRIHITGMDGVPYNLIRKRMVRLGIAPPAPPPPQPVYTPQMHQYIQHQHQQPLMMHPQQMSMMHQQQHYYQQQQQQQQRPPWQQPPVRPPVAPSQPWQPPSAPLSAPPLPPTGPPPGPPPTPPPSRPAPPVLLPGPPPPTSVPVAALAPPPTVVKLPVADVKLPVADVKLPVTPNTVIVNPYATQSKVDPVKNEKKRNFIFRQAGMSMEELRAQCAKYKPLQPADADNS